MHLLVLSAFRPVVEDRVPSSLLSQCTFWCSVLSDATNKLREAISTKSQCTFWCSVLSDRGRLARQHVPYPVSMHLLVLSAFRLSARHSKTLLSSRLNAPSGAQCFPTLCLRRCGSFSLPVSMHLLVLSAFRLLQRQDGSVAYIQVSMHLLVLSAFRRGEACYQRSADHVSMHLLVLSAFRRNGRGRSADARCSSLNAPSGAQCFPTIESNIPDVNFIQGSQCTFWCSVLSDGHGGGASGHQKGRLNAPSGAQCFPTLSRASPCGVMQSQCTFWCSVLSDCTWHYMNPTYLDVSMHLLVLSAFRRAGKGDGEPLRSGTSQCTFWCSVLSDRYPSARWNIRCSMSQCTFWCSVLSDLKKRIATSLCELVSMHLLVLSAFRPSQRQDHRALYASVSMHLLVLSAFRQYERGEGGQVMLVSMHLLVLSAFRLRPQKTAPQRRLPERNRRRPGKHHIESARTCPIKPHNREKPPQNDPAPPTAPTHQYATDFQRTQAKKPTPHDYVTVNTTTKATVDCPCGDTADRFPPTALLGPTAVSR